jgi:hypothetical protein
LAFLLKNTIKCLLPCGYTGYEVIKDHQKKERYRSEYLMKFVLEAARLFLSSHIWEIPWAGGSWEDERFLFAALLYWKRFFFYNLLLLLLGNNRGVGLSRFSLGELIAAPQCANRTGESGLFICFLFLFSKPVTIPPLWETQRVDLSCLVLLFAALTNTRALCVTGYFPLRLRKKDNCLIIILCFCFYYLFLFC